MHSISLLTLDLSVASTGFAVGTDLSGRPRTGSWSFPKGPENLDRALAALRAQVVGLIKLESVNVVAIEAAWQLIDAEHSATSNFNQICLQAVAREAAYAFKCQVYLVNVRRWRKDFLGEYEVVGTDRDFRRKQLKKLAMDRCRQLGWEVVNDDAAESAGIFYSHMSRNAPHWHPSNESIGRLAL